MAPPDNPGTNENYPLYTVHIVAIFDGRYVDIYIGLTNLNEFCSAIGGFRNLVHKKLIIEAHRLVSVYYIYRPALGTKKAHAG